MIKGIVAIVGRPNVGKSTLFNKLAKGARAIVDDQPGVTRDRLYGTALYDKDDSNDGFVVVDTGGFETDDFNFQPFEDNVVWRQTETAIHESDLVLFLLDGKHGLHQHDVDIYRHLKEIGKPMVIAVNKVDGVEKEREQLWDFFELGEEDLLSISAAHSRAIRPLLSRIGERLGELPSLHSSSDNAGATKVALIGRPNAGKSSILNRLAGEERVVVSDVAGTTRDAVDISVGFEGKRYVFVDTAGVRRRSRVNESLEVQSVMRSLRAIDKSDVVLIVIDAIEGITDQDARLINLALDRHKPLQLVFNKWDLVPNKTTNTARNYERNVRNIIQDHKYIPVTFVSCLKNQRIHGVMKKVDLLVQESNKRVATARINEALRTIVENHTPQLIKKYSKRVKFYYATQVRTCPPTIVVKCNIEKEIQTSYKRYMANRFRKLLGFESVPIRIYFRGKSEGESGQAKEREHYRRMIEKDLAEGRTNAEEFETLKERDVATELR